jgi:hypothetical protein
MNRMIVLSTAGVPHLILTALLAIVISGMIALFGHRSTRERVYHAGYLFVCCIASVVAGSWFMYLIHG